MSERLTSDALERWADIVREMADQPRPLDPVDSRVMLNTAARKLRSAAQYQRDLILLRAAAQQVIAALDRTDIWDDDQGSPAIIEAAGEAVGRLRALLPVPPHERGRTA